MQTALLVLVHFLAVLSIMLLYYFIPALIFYYLFYIKNKQQWQHLKIQQKHPGSAQVPREIKYSLLSILIFSITGLLMYEAATRGYTSVYFDINGHSLFYFGLSLVLCIFANDTLFYW